MNPDRKHDIFLSYSRKDIDLMRRVRDDLKTAGFQVWTDEGIEPGTPLWDQAIEAGLDNASCVVVILTPNAKAAGGVRKEIHYAEDAQLHIFPIMAVGNGSNAIPWTLAGRQWTDIRTNYQSGMQQLILVMRDYLNNLDDEGSLPSAVSITPFANARSKGVNLPFEPLDRRLESSEKEQLHIIRTMLMLLDDNADAIIELVGEIRDAISEDRHPNVSPDSVQARIAELYQRLGTINDDLKKVPVSDNIENKAVRSNINNRIYKMNTAIDSWSRDIEQFKNRINQIEQEKTLTRRHKREHQELTLIKTATARMEDINVEIDDCTVQLATLRGQHLSGKKAGAALVAFQQRLGVLRSEVGIIRQKVDSLGTNRFESAAAHKALSDVQANQLMLQQKLTGYQKALSTESELVKLIPNKLNPWNPLDWVKYLFWLFFYPDQIRAYHLRFGNQPQTRYLLINYLHSNKSLQNMDNIFGYTLLLVLYATLANFASQIIEGWFNTPFTDQSFSGWFYFIIIASLIIWFTGVLGNDTSSVITYLGLLVGVIALIHYATLQFQLLGQTTNVSNFGEVIRIIGSSIGVGFLGMVIFITLFMPWWDSDSGVPRVPLGVALIISVTIFLTVVRLWSLVAEGAMPFIISFVLCATIGVILSNSLTNQVREQRGVLRQASHLLILCLFLLAYSLLWWLFVLNGWELIETFIV